MATLSFPEARRQFDSLPSQLERDPDTPVVITEGGKQVMVVLSWERYESLLETSEIRKDRELIQAIEKGIQEIKEGRGVSWKDAQRRLGWDRL